MTTTQRERSLRLALALTTALVAGACDDEGVALETRSAAIEAAPEAAADELGDLRPEERVAARGVDPRVIERLLADPGIDDVLRDVGFGPDRARGDTRERLIAFLDATAATQRTIDVSRNEEPFCASDPIEDDRAPIDAEPIEPTPIAPTPRTEPDVATAVYAFAPAPEVVDAAPGEVATDR